MTDQHLLERFELAETWQKDFAGDSHWVAKHRLMEAMIPDGVETILDVGCGNGAQAELLSHRYAVTGFDASEVALRHTTVPRIRGFGNALPFRSHSYDLVWSSEMLEHLPDDQLAATVAEMQRVSRRSLLISVPYRENLLARTTRCHSCKRLFHIYGHLQSFSLPRLSALIRPFVLQSWAFCGSEVSPYHPVLLFLKHNLGRKWFSLPDALPVCPYCGYHEQEVWYGNRFARWSDRLNDYYSARRPTRYRYWIVTRWKAVE